MNVTTYVKFLKWICRAIFELFPYGLILFLAGLSAGFFVYAPFGKMSIELSSATAFIALILAAYIFHNC